MSDILPILRDLLLAQRGCSKLCSIPVGLMDQADAALADLKSLYATSRDEQVMNLIESVATTLDELQEERALIIWWMAYNQEEPERTFQDHEQAMFSDLVDMAAKIRGIV